MVKKACGDLDRLVAGGWHVEGWINDPIADVRMDL